MTRVPALAFPASLFLAVLASCDGHAFDPQVQPPARSDVAGGDAGDGAAAETVADVAVVADAAPDALAEAPSEASVSGCTDPEAKNYDPAATVDDGSCLYDVTVTFLLDVTCQKYAPSPNVAGGGTFGMPGDHPMTDFDKDGIYTLEVDLSPGLGTAFTFTAAECTNWSCKEDIAGQPCAVEPYNDRWLAVGTTDMEVRACFARCGDGFCGQCPKDAPAPAPIPACDPPKVKVRFRVDLSTHWDVAIDNVIALHGSFDATGPGVVMERLADSGGRRTVFATTLCLEPDSNHTYWFGGFQNDVTEFSDGAPCAGRPLRTPATDTDLPVAAWGECP